MSKSVFTNAQKILVEELVAARSRSGMRQEDVAAVIGKDQSLISNIERGQRGIDVIEFIVLVRAIKADPLELFEGVLKRLPNEISI